MWLLLIYMAEYDNDYSYNDAPDKCSACDHVYFRVSAFSWICDNCEEHNPADKERSEKYEQIKELKRAERARKRGKRAKSKKDIEDEINML